MKVKNSISMEEELWKTLAEKAQGNVSGYIENVLVKSLELQGIRIEKKETPLQFIGRTR